MRHIIDLLLHARKLRVKSLRRVAADNRSKLYLSDVYLMTA